LILLTKECVRHILASTSTSGYETIRREAFARAFGKNQDGALIMKQHKLHFTTWLKDLNLPIGEIEE
jgi:hypothetical protein